MTASFVAALLAGGRWLLAFITRAWPWLLAALAALVLASALLRLAGERRAVEAVQAEAGATVARAGEAASIAAAAAVADQADREAARTQTTEENRDEILSAPDAGVDAGAAGRAGLVGLCRRPAYRDHPGCLELRPPDPAAAAR